MVTVPDNNVLHTQFRYLWKEDTQCWRQCWRPDDQGGSHRNLRLGHTIQGSHPILDLVLTSEVITALSRKQEVEHTKRQVPEILQRMLHNTSEP